MLKIHIVKEAKEAVLYFVQDVWVNFDRGWQSYGRISVILIYRLNWRKSTLLAFTTLYNQFFEKTSLGTPELNVSWCIDLSLLIDYSTYFKDAI